ncbi:MAG: efflux RND transporter permease subunit, partial [Vicinamibacterales bacterium]
MLDGLIHWSLRNRALVLGVSALLLAGGTYTATTMPVDVLPDLTAPTVTILVEGGGMAPTDMEALVTFPLEAALNGGPGVRRVRSATAVGVAVIWVEFDWGQEIYQARQTVSERLIMVAGELPPEVAPPTLAPISSIMGEVLFAALESDRHSPRELRTVADAVIRRRLLAVPGVAQVTVTGGDRRQYEVVVTPERLAEFNLTLGDVEAALASNRNASAGFRVSGGQEYLVRGIGRLDGLDDIAATVVATRNTSPVLIRDIGAVRIGDALKRGAGSHNAEPAVILGIQKQPNVNTLELTAALDEVVADIQASLPEGMVIATDIFRQADFIEAAIENLTSAVRDGTVLVILIVLLFLANIRAGGISLVAIPLSLVGAVATIKLLGGTINSMTLGGMAIAIGALVDDAIINVENVVRRLKENAHRPEAERRPAWEVVYRASSEIRGSIVFATLVIMLVFVPLFFLAGVEGRLLQPLGLAYLVALFTSLIVALTVTPVLCSYLLPRSRAVTRAEDVWVVAQLKRLYGRVLPVALNNASLTLVTAGLVLLVALVAGSRLGRSFLPEFNEGALTISTVTVPGISLEESDRLGASIERLLLDVPEVTNTARRTGRAELDEHVQGVESAEIDVQLRMGDRPKDVVLQEIRDRLSLVPGTNITVGQPISHRIDHMLSGTRANVAVKVFGPDLQTLRSLAEQVEAEMSGIIGVVDLSTEQQTNIPTIRVRFDRPALARYGLSAGEAATALEVAMRGRTVGHILESGLSVPLVLRYPAAASGDLEIMRQTLIDTGSEAKVPLG